MENKPKHTPGPWTAEQDGNIYDIKSGGFTPCTTNVIDAETDAANAALIAAAPELLEVLQQLKRDYDSEKRNCRGLEERQAEFLQDVSVLYWKISAAIAKAEGR